MHRLIAPLGVIGNTMVSLVSLSPRTLPLLHLGMFALAFAIGVGCTSLPHEPLPSEESPHNGSGGGDTSCDEPPCQNAEGGAAPEEPPPADPAPPSEDGVRAFPGAIGFGTDSVCGRGGQVFVVRSQGDFDACLTHEGPRTCAFEVSGTFSATRVTTPFLTIAGESAPSPGVQISPNLDVRTHDVCVRHVRFRGDGNVGDVVHLNHRQDDGEEQTYNIVFDHISVSWSRDENFSSYCGPGNAEAGMPGTPDGTVHDVTLSNSISSEGLLGHSMGFLAARPGHDRFSVIGNVFANNNGRNPKLGSGTFVVANNLIFNAGNRAIALGSSGGVFDGLIISNAIVSGPDTNASLLPIDGETGNDGMNSLYVADNTFDGVSPADPWSLVRWVGDNLSAADSPQPWSAAIGSPPLAVSDVFQHNIACAGARPLDRDPVDTRVMSGVADGDGTLLASAPALPDLSGGSHTLPAVFTSPDNWARDTDGDGYTDVEEELHAMADALSCQP